MDGSIHNIKGILHTQDVLQVPDSEAHTRTVCNPDAQGRLLCSGGVSWSVIFCEKMQRSNIRMAIVVDEYGGVAGPRNH